MAAPTRSARRAGAAHPATPIASAAAAVQQLTCARCGNAMTDREVLFYAVGAPDVRELLCRNCLAMDERMRGHRVERTAAAARARTRRLRTPPGVPSAA